jgi:glycosyltransferase involved in cell wall biosynthesis
MKILYIANVRIPTEKAHGLQIMKMCEAFTKAGSIVKLVLPTRKNFQLKNAVPFDFYKINHLFDLSYLKTHDPVWLMKLPFGLYLKIQSTLYTFSLWRYLKKNIKDRVDVIYTRDEYLLPFLNQFAEKLVWEAHNLPQKRNYYLKYWRRCHKIIAITAGLKNELVRMGLDPKRILVAPDGVDLNEFSKITADQAEIRKRLSLPLNKKIIMYTGHLYDWKGAHTLARVAPDLTGNELLVFVGGTNREALDFKNKFGREKNILIAGHVNHDLIPSYLAAADVLVLPNSAKKEISRSYTSPMKLFEYLAAKKPIVASDLPSIREILNEDNAILVEPDSSSALAVAINRLLNNPQLANDIASKSNQDVDQYSWSNRAKNIISFISK